MAESRFIKTVAFGGYDKSDVDNKLNYLYTQVYDLKNELRVAKLMNAKLRDGADEETAEKSVLANESIKLTELQVKNQALNEKLKTAESDNKAKEDELVTLRARVKELEEQLSETSTKLAAASGGEESAMFGVVFAEAQKSANMIVATAKQNADNLEADAKKLAENMVADANNKASKIVYEAEKNAAQIEADAKNDAANMSAASENMKAVMLGDVTKLGDEIARLKSVLVEFEKNSIESIEQTEKLITDTKTELTAGGVPVFKEPELVEAELPEEPEYDEIDDSYLTGAKPKKKNKALDKLKALADSIGKDAKEESDDEPEEAAEETADDEAEAVETEAVEEEAEEEASEQTPEEPEKEAPKSNSLGDLLKKAKSIK